MTWLAPHPLRARQRGAVEITVCAAMRRVTKLSSRRNAPGLLWLCPLRDGLARCDSSMQTTQRLLMQHHDRRTFLKLLGSGALAAALPASIERALAIPANNRTPRIP